MPHIKSLNFHKSNERRLPARVGSYRDHCSAGMEVSTVPWLLEGQTWTDHSPIHVLTVKHLSFYHSYSKCLR